MAYAPLPKLVPISASNMCPNNINIPLSEVLRSDPVKRLFNQPNIIIKTIPLGSTVKLDKDLFGNKRNGLNAPKLNNVKPPAISIVPIEMPDEEKDDANLLPSKVEDKKSEIALLPIRKKLCGHYEPCEIIVCEVMVQQYVDNANDRVSPMLAVNIEEEEINAPVGKHCNNKYCDALSIDHNRCRRVSIKLNRCDKSRACDICGITLEGRRSRMHHRNCARKDEYRHNNVDRAHLLKERMRERELQILEITKMKRNDYSDPTKAMESLRKNEEIIIIPKTAPSQQPIITITSVPAPQSIGTNLSNVQPVKINSQGNNFASVFGNMPFTITPQNASRPVEGKTQSINPVAFTNLQQKPYATSTSTPTSVPATVVTSAPSQSQYVRLATGSSQNNLQGLINNWVVSASHVLTTAPIQAKPFLTPIRVVPITNLLTAPSLLHRTQGVPKFCIMAENHAVTPVTVLNLPPLQPAPATVPNIATTVNTAATTTATTVVTSNTATTTRRKIPIQQLPMQKLHKRHKKIFFCKFCSKYFSTDWYFKMHVAKHKGEKLFFCNICDDESFSNKYDIKKHMAKQHNTQKEMFTMRRPNEFPCNKCGYVSKSYAFSRIHANRHAKSNSDKADVKLKQRKLKPSDAKIQHTTPIHDSNGKNTKKINCQDTPGNPNKNKVDSVIETKKKGNIKTFQNTTIKNDDDDGDMDLSMSNENSSAKMNGFTFVSVEENLDPKNYKQESIMS